MRIKDIKPAKYNPRKISKEQLRLLNGDPLSWQIWNIFRSRWVSRFWQENGVKIIPDISWAEPKTFDFCFAGIPKNLPCVSIQSQNIGKLKKDKYLFAIGLKEAIKRLLPKKVLCYGEDSKKDFVKSIINGVNKNIKIAWCSTWMEQRRKVLRLKRRR